MEDRELIKRIQAGERHLLSQLIKRYYDDIYRFCCHKTSNASLAGDLTQDTFMNLIKYIDNYRDYKKFKSYLFTITLNICNDHFRKQRVSWADPDQLEELSEDDRRLHRVELSDSVQQALDQLPDMQKDVIILRFYHDMKVQDIARVTGVGLPTAKSRLKQGLAKLQKLLGKDWT